MSDAADDVHETLAAIASEPPDQWQRLLELRFHDRLALVQQGLLWLRADRERPEDEAAPPSLGRAGDERYELRFRLASGTTASVWRAHDRKLGRDVAVKVFVRSTDGAAVELMEARAACDVISDHVVRVLDVHDAGAHPYIVMELVAEHDAEHDDVAIGLSASACRPRSIDEAARWVLDVARGVRDAHLRNVFHRDLKPHNVLITPISRRARIADFGLALSAANDQLGRPPSLTMRRGASGPVAIAGTPEYMAPEQARGLPRNLDPLRGDERRTLVAIDVWGLGALAYDLLAGRAPWMSSTQLEAWELAASGATPPAARRMADGTRIPTTLARVVSKALAHDPEDRYRSAGQIVVELEAFLARHPTSFERAVPRRAALWLRRNPQLAIAGLVALALGAMTLATYATVVGLREQRRALDAEVSQQQLDEAQLKARAQALRGDLDRRERQLATEGQELTTLEAKLTDEQRLYADLLAAKEKALADATATTRDLVDRLGAATAELRDGKVEQERLRALADSARTEADRTAKARDQAQADRDTARSERDALAKERDQRGVERDQARLERDQAAHEVARLAAALAAADAKLAASEHAQPNPDAAAGSDASTTAGSARP